MTLLWGNLLRNTLFNVGHLSDSLTSCHYRHRVTVTVSWSAKATFGNENRSNREQISRIVTREAEVRF